MQLGDKVGFEPADWLYSESLTRSSKVPVCQSEAQFFFLA
jgi:hypothetical protein